MRYNRDSVKAQLPHKNNSKVRAIYYHDQYIEQRLVIMQEWSNLLDKWEKSIRKIEFLKIHFFL